MSKCKGYFFYYFDLVGTVSTTNSIETFLFSVSKNGYLLFHNHAKTLV